MSEINEVIGLLKAHSADLKKLGLGRVYSYLYPVSGKTADKTADVMISEVTSVPDAFGSDLNTHNIQTIQLNIFYGNNFANMDAFEDSMAFFICEEGWIELPNGGRYPDPNTQAITKIIQFKRRKTRWKLQA